VSRRATYKLLTKTVIIYLVITFLAFILIGFYLIREANNLIHEDLEHKYTRMTDKVLLHIHHHENLDEYLGKWNRNVLVERIGKEEDESIYPIYQDTLIYNADSEEFHIFRVKKVVEHTEKGTFKIVIVRPVQEFYNYRDDIFGTILPTFIALAVFMVVLNLALSKYLLYPFHRILEQMRLYKVGKGALVSDVKTTTTEFDKMQNLYRGMIDQIDKDYKNLKEYTEDLAHELQTPLAVIRNKVDNLIANSSIMEEDAKSIQSIYEETNHLSKLAQGLNLLTKIENQEFKNSKKIRTAIVIEKHIEAVKELANLKSIKIVSDLETNHYYKMDPFLLDTLLKNLVRNSIHYCESNGRVEISTNNEGYFKISNDGPPLEIDSERLFDRFTHSSGFKQSLGLGLSIVKKVCETNSLDIVYTYVNGKHIFSISTID